MKNSKKVSKFIVDFLTKSKGVVSVDNKNVTAYSIDEIWYFDYDKYTNSIWVVYENVWSVLANEFGHSDIEIKNLLTTHIEKYLEIKGFSIKIMY